jgi:hypothetical protein
MTILKGLAVNGLNRTSLDKKNPQTLSSCGLKRLYWKSLEQQMVPKVGVEPTRASPHAPQACASTNSTTSALMFFYFFTAPSPSAWGSTTISSLAIGFAV